MLTTQDSRKETRSPARFAATILFVLAVGMSYTASSRVEGAVGLPDSVEDQEMAEPAYPESECVSGGLVFSDCFLDY